MKFFFPSLVKASKNWCHIGDWVRTVSTYAIMIKSPKSNLWVAWIFCLFVRASSLYFQDLRGQQNTFHVSSTYLLVFLFLTFHNYPGLLVFEPSKKASPLSSLWCMEPMIICWKCKESPWTPYTFVTIGTLVRSWYRASISPLLCGRRDKGENSPPFKSADPLLCLSEKPLQPLRFLDDMLSYTFYR